MSYKVELKDSIREVEITVDISTPGLRAREAKIDALLTAITDMHMVIPLASVECVAVPESNPIMDYSIMAQDGREWHQTLDFTTPIVGMTFNVTDPWALPEFMWHRAIREAIIDLKQSWYITKIEVTYL